MRMTERDFEKRMSAAFAPGEAPSPDFEGRLFLKAEEVLAARRDLHAESRRKAAAVALRRSRFFEEMWDAILRLLPRPGLQAAGLLVLVSIVLVMRSSSQGPVLTFADLPAHPRFNPAPARYDALWLAERTADEREVEDAHRETSGGS